MTIFDDLSQSDGTVYFCEVHFMSRDPAQIWLLAQPYLKTVSGQKGHSDCTDYNGPASNQKYWRVVWLVCVCVFFSFTSHQHLR